MSLRTRIAAIDAKHGEHLGFPPGRCTIAKWTMVATWALLSLYIVPCWVFSGSLNEEIGGQPYPGLGTGFWLVIYLFMTALWIIACCVFDHHWHELRPQRLERVREHREAELNKRYVDLLNKLWRRHRSRYNGTEHIRNRWCPMFVIETHISLTSASNCLVASSGVAWAHQPAFRIGLDYNASTECLEIAHYDHRSNRLPGSPKLTYRRYRTLIKAIKAFDK